MKATISINGNEQSVQLRNFALQVEGLSRRDGDAQASSSRDGWGTRVTETISLNGGQLTTIVKISGGGRTTTTTTTTDGETTTTTTTTTDGDGNTSTTTTTTNGNGSNTVTQP